MQCFSELFPGDTQKVHLFNAFSQLTKDSRQNQVLRSVDFLPLHSHDFQKEAVEFLK